MQTNVAAPQSLTQSRGLSKTVRLWIRLGLLSIVFFGVTSPLFHHMLVNAGETDAKGAVRLIARELAAMPETPPENLAVWMQDQPLIRHRLADARILDSHLEYHGYRITWISAEVGNPARGTVWAIPINPGKTGHTRFHLEVR